PLMPILIPPTGTKRFHEYGEIFKRLWREAEDKLRNAARLVIIGYSFPSTDTHAFSLLDSFVPTRNSNKMIEIIDPNPESIEFRVRSHLGNRCTIVSNAKTFAEFLSMPNIELSSEQCESAILEKGDGLENDLDERQNFILDLLCNLNLSGEKFDLTTYSGTRFLNSVLPGEFATHLYGHFNQEAFEYRLLNIPIKSSEGEEVRVPLSDIWIVHPLPKREISDEDLKAVDLSQVDNELKEMIRKGYLCKDEKEFDYFLRRFLAS
ncbi:MAG: hypothetical protein R3B95_21835, partial [Nitrospirales bacterium]|nr:hypothetical protein [Nitrospirales bacterium]